jgi:hypothetical protein
MYNIYEAQKRFRSGGPLLFGRVLSETRMADLPGPAERP